MKFNCRICGSSAEHRTHTAREMMFGTRREFEYVECGDCGTVQLAEVPDLAPYYPKEYYSLSEGGQAGVRGAVSRFLTQLYLRIGRGRISKAIFSWEPMDDLRARAVDRGLGLLSVLRLDIPKASRILDVGCGDGKLLRVLAGAGFSSLTGTDPFVASDTTYSDGVRILKRELKEVDGRFDLVMFHHSLEHLRDPLDTLRTAMGLLAEGGRCLVRIPVLNEAWERYGVDWVGLDAPRHLFLFSEAGFRRAAEIAGFVVEDVVYDSTSFQFSASEMYKRDIPLSGASDALFTAREYKQWRREARRLNRSGRGDQAAFYLKADTARS